MTLIDAVLASRGLTDAHARQAFLHPEYDAYRHDPFLLPDMDRAVQRLRVAHARKETVVIYGDYDIDGLSATTLLLDAFASFGINVRAFIPNRFVEGYGLAASAIDDIAKNGADLIVTVDCGSLSHTEIAYAAKLGVDVIVTDHHSVADTMPPAVAVINPKRLAEEHADLYENYLLKKPNAQLYPFLDLAGVGVAFKLVQAMQQTMEGLEDGHEKWLLDLVALGTVCDVVQLRDENRANVFWGLQVMKKTRRPGLRLLMAVSGVAPEKLNARSLGFALGPRLNAAGRLETAQLALDLLTTNDNTRALELAELLDTMNRQRRTEQDRIFKAAKKQVDTERANDAVIVVSDPTWSHGIIGIVAAKLLETYYKPTFVLQELEDGTAKGSARSFGDFSAVEAIRATETLLIKGGGHKLAAGVTLDTQNIVSWRSAMNKFYRGLRLVDQLRHLQPKSDVTLNDFRLCTEGNIEDLSRMEPYGNGNPEPVFEFMKLTVTDRRTMGADRQHVKYSFRDKNGQSMDMIAFNKAHEFTADVGENVQVLCELGINEWNGRRSIEGVLKRLELVSL